MRLFARPLLVLAFLFCLSLIPRRSEAKIPFLITYGDSISQLGPLPVDKKEVLEKVTRPGAEVGYKYSYFGLFFLDLWTWGGEYCLFHEKSFWSLKPEQAAELLNVPVEKLPKPFFYRFPSLLSVLVLGILGLILLGRFIKTDEEEAVELMKDERYREALELFKKKWTEVSATPEKPAEATAGGETPAPATDKPATESAATEKPATEKPATEGSDDDADEAKEAEQAKKLALALAPGISYLVDKGVPAEQAGSKLALLARVEVLAKNTAASEAAPAAT